MLVLLKLIYREVRGWIYDAKAWTQSSGGGEPDLDLLAVTAMYNSMP